MMGTLRRVVPHSNPEVLHSLADRRGGHDSRADAGSGETAVLCLGSFAVVPSGSFLDATNAPPHS